MPHHPLPADLTPFPFTTAEARRSSVGRGRLRGSDLAHPHHGIYVAAAAATDDDVFARCERLLPALGERHWFSHGTAARIWGMPLGGRYLASDPLHVTSIASDVAFRHRGTVGWVTADASIGRGVFGMLPVIAPADAWCQLAIRGAVVARRTVPHEWLVAAGDFLLTGKRKGRGEREAALCTIDELRAAVARRGRGRGAALLRVALEDLRWPVDSPNETRLRLGLVAYRLPEPQVQVPVMTADGLRHADLGYPEERVLLEFQGDEHRTSRRRWLRDLTRVQLFQDAGYHVILIGAADLEPNCAPLAARVRRALARGREAARQHRLRAGSGAFVRLRG
jgi:hypothetical protein